MPAKLGTRRVPSFTGRGGDLENMEPDFLGFELLGCT